MEGCNQQDFLPFKCSLCSKSLCLLHRSAVAHSCVAGGVVDVISMACPICGKSIKMNRADDPNIEWDRHFTTSCDHKPPSTAQQQPTTRCAAPNCSTTLGPSNQIKCNLCNRQVCLSHRSTEAHKCKELKRADMLQNQIRANPKLFSSPPSQSSSAKTSNPPAAGVKSTSSSQKTTNKSQAKKSAQADPSNSLQGTAHRRQQQSSSSSLSPSGPAQSSIEPCPICGENFSSLQLLTAHLDERHLNPAPVPAHAPTPSSAEAKTSTNGGEVCPQCSSRFDNIVDLIQHVERDHAVKGSSSSDNCDLS
jgi:predicted nucleic acid binding AN1-type Zn finger protein